MVDRWRYRALSGLAVCSAFIVAACTEPTPYGPAIHSNGYSDQAIEENRYRVSFSGNSRTPRDTVETYLLYRAAELTVESGHDWFRVSDRDTEITTRYRGFVSGFGSRGFGPFFFRSGFRSSAFGGFASTSTRPINRYEAFANILVFDGEKPGEDASAYDARSVLETLGPEIVLPSEKDGFG